jgi:hypothetical protein
MVDLSIKTGNLVDERGEQKTLGPEIAMFKIVRFPKKLESFFAPLHHQFHWDHFQYFRTLVLLIVIAWGRRNVANLCRHLDGRGRPHRSRYNNFLNLNRWEPAVVLRMKASDLVDALSPRPGDDLAILIDDSKKGKRGRDMEAVSWIHDPTTGRNIRGHQYVTATLSFRGHTIPLGIRLYVKKEDCRGLGVRFRKTTQLAAQMIREFNPPAGVRVRVLFDSYYLCPTVVKACQSKGFHFVSTLKSNRNLYKNGRKLKAGKYGRKLFHSGRKRTYSLAKTRGRVTYTYVDAGGMDVSDLGKLHVIFSRKNHEPNVLGIVTDDPTMSARQMIQTYDERWSIEVFFKDGKQLLGLGQYQNGSYQAAVNHLHLVCFARALLTHIAIMREGEKAKTKRKLAVRLSAADLQNETRRIVWEDLTDHLKRFSSGTQIVKELERLLIAA